jgi:uncharacterized protein YdaU (DUF1376 family)
MKDPAFLFYSDNFMSGTMFFSDEQVGKYIRLLCAQHLTGHLLENHMIFICKKYDEEIFKKFVKDEEGKYYNIRLEEEIIKRYNYSKSRSENKLGKTKKTKIISKSHDKHMGNGNEDENTVVNNKKALSEKFEIFRKSYPGTKCGFQCELDKFIKKSQNGDIDLLLPALEKEKSHKAKLRELNKFCPEWKNLSTWINQKCWMQEFPETETNTLLIKEEITQEQKDYLARFNQK